MHHKIITVILLSAISASCAGRVVHMEDDQGNKVTCEVSTGSAMMTGVLVRDSSINNCIKDREEAGFKVVSEE